MLLATVQSTVGIAFSCAAWAAAAAARRRARAGTGGLAAVRCQGLELAYCTQETWYGAG